MTEADAVERARLPRTRKNLAGDLRSLGLEEGATVLVHSSLSSLGWVCGGPVAVIQALMDVLGPSGTLAMPAHSGDNSDPAEWQHPPVPPDWWPVIRENTPAFDPLVTPTRAMGRIAETFRTWPGVLRSSHPCVSFAARGEHGAFITGSHSLEYSLGEGSPLARLYDLDSLVLLLGVGYDRCTSLHLAEVRSGRAALLEAGSPILIDGQRAWKTYEDLAYDDSSFEEIGAAFEEGEGARIGLVGSATARLFQQREAVDFATAWFRKDG